MTPQKRKKKTDSFQSKSISAFSSAVTPRLAKAFPEKYSLKTAKGKLELQKDIATLRLACANKTPPSVDSISDRQLFTSLLDKQRNILNEVYAPGNRLKANANVNQTTVNLAVSPVRTERRKTKGQKVQALKVVKSWSRHLKENISIKRRNLIVARRAGPRSLGKSTENVTVPVSQRMITIFQKRKGRTLERLLQ